MVNKEFLKGVIVAYFKVQSQHLFEGTRQPVKH
jgi:hypothetical protein